MTSWNRLFEVYRALGRVLNDPAVFGLSHRAPASLVEALTACRQKLMEEMVEQRRWQEDEEGSLEAELSQDSDTTVLSESKRELCARTSPRTR